MDYVISNMQTLMSSDNALQIDLQNDFPLFQTSQQTDPNERIMVINVELIKLDEEKKSALNDNGLLMNIIHRIQRLSDEKLVSLFHCWCEILTATDAMVQLLTFSFLSSPLTQPSPPSHIIT